MKKAIVLMGGLLLLSACATVDYTERERIECERQGFILGSPAFNDCVYQLREVHVERREEMRRTVVRPES